MAYVLYKPSLIIQFKYDRLYLYLILEMLYSKRTLKSQFIAWQYMSIQFLQAFSMNF